MNNIWKFVILIIGSYLLGNINFARIFARTRKDDITTHGSGNPGTMNMLRTHGVWLAVATLVFDALKSVVSCLIGYFWLKATADAYTANLAIYICGLACILGHNYPVIFKFKGGKGVATGFGLVCVARPILIPVVLGVFFIVFLIWKVASLSSLSAVFTFLISESIFLLIKGYYASFIVLVLCVSFIFYAHRKNIKKFFEKKESKIDLKEAVQKDKDYAKKQKEKRALKKQERLEKKSKKTKELNESKVETTEETVEVETVTNNEESSNLEESE